VVEKDERNREHIMPSKRLPAPSPVISSVWNHNGVSRPLR